MVFIYLCTTHILFFLSTHHIATINPLRNIQD